MSEIFDYEVTIKGMETIPLRTTKTGLIALMKAFDKDENICESLIKAMREKGIAFKTNLVSVRLRKKKTKK